MHLSYIFYLMRNQEQMLTNCAVNILEIPVVNVTNVHFMQRNASSVTCNAALWALFKVK